jgi:hypothetical protein
MPKIRLYPSPKENQFRALIGRNRIGQAYPIRQYRDGFIDVLECVVTQPGKPGAANFRFILAGKDWITDSEPYSHTHDYKPK